MDARDKQVTERARAIAGEFGLETLDVEAMKEITPAEWRAWGQMKETRRLIGFLAEGLAVCSEAAEVAETKRKHMRGMTAGTRNDLAKQEVVARHQTEIYRKLLRGIGHLANKGA
jgi:hypothetical protein